MKMVVSSSEAPEAPEAYKIDNVTKFDDSISEIIIEVSGGTFINEAFNNAWDLYLKMKKSVSFRFNGSTIRLEMRIS